MNLRQGIGQKYRESSFQTKKSVLPNQLHSQSSHRLIDKEIGLTVSQEPVDVVYTWVNGSDPVFQQTLYREKVRIYEQHKASNLKPLLKDEHCDQVRSTQMVLIKNASIPVALLRLPAGAIELPYETETQVFENSRLFSFLDEKSGKQVMSAESLISQ